jgi:hypothetical protein
MKGAQVTIRVGSRQGENAAGALEAAMTHALLTLSLYPAGK